MIKLFASDLDGTLLNEAHECDETIRQGIETLKSDGRLFAAATGRNRTMVETAALPDIYYVCLNGAAILSPQDDILYLREIDKDLVKELYEKFPDLCLEFNTVFDVYSAHGDECDMMKQKKANPEAEKDLPIRFKEDDRRALMMDAHRYNNQSLNEILAQPIVKINCLNSGDERCADLQAFLEARASRLINAPSYDWLFEITAADVSKADALKKLAQIKGIEEHEVAVYGDGGNDVVMLSAFENSFCPETGSEPAKEAANTIIGPYNEYSVIRHMLETAGKE